MDGHPLGFRHLRGLLFSIFIVNPALKGWAIIIRPLTRTEHSPQVLRTAPSLTVGLPPRLLT